MSPIAAFTDVTVSYDERRVLGPLSLVVNEGEHWALLGPNGSGKTTLLGMLGAQRHPTTGTAMVLGEKLGATDMRQLRRRIGVVGHAVSDLLPLHSSALEITLTGKESIFAPWWSTFDDADRKHATMLLERVGCGHLINQAYGRCSQGERQRVLLARALYGAHELLLLDEPATGVDFPGREALIASLESLVTDMPQLSSVHVVHTLEELPRTISHCLMLRDGATIAKGPVADVLTNENLSTCFDIPITITTSDGRYGATARRGW